MATISIFILVILGISCLAALIAVLVYYIRYRRHISRVMNGEEAPNEKRITSPGETALSILIILLLVWNGFSLVQFSIVNNDLNNIRSKMTDISRDLSIMEHELSDKIDNSGSIVRDFQFIENSLDRQTLSFTYDIEVNLKEYRNDTEVYLNYGYNRIRMEKADGKYTTSMTVRLGECIYDYAYVEIINDGVTRIDTLQGTPTGPVWKDFLPQVYMSKAPWEIKEKKGSVTIKDDMKFRMVTRASDVAVTAAYLVTELNGSEIGRQKLDISTPQDEVTVPIGKTYELKDGDVLAFYTITETDLGISYKSVMFTQGNDDGSIPYEQLIDSDGSILYSE